MAESNAGSEGPAHATPGAQPAPLPANEAARLAALERYEILDTAPEEAFEDLVSLASYICDAPTALLTFVDSERQWFKARIGFEQSETSRDVAFCAHAILHPDEVMVVPDAQRDPRFSANPLVVGESNVRFYAGAPLVTPDGLALGTLCVIDTAPRQLRPEQLAALQRLARRAGAELELRRGIGVIHRQIEARQTAETLLSRKIEILEILHQTSYEIAAAHELETIFAIAHRGAAGLMPAEVFVISLLDQENEEVEDVYLIDRSGRSPNRRHPLGDQGGLGARVITTGRPLRLDDWDEATAKSLGADVFGDGVDTRSHLTVPLRVGAEILGAMGVQDYAPNVYSEEDEQLLAMLGYEVASSIQNARLLQSIREGGELFRKMEEAREEERRLLAAELHDQVGQAITGLLLNLQLIRDSVPARTKKAVLGRIDDSLSMLQDVAQLVGNVMVDLRPPMLDDLGLLSALRWHARQFAERTGIAAHVAGEEFQPRLGRQTEIVIFRIVQEALNNVCKHAGASRVEVVVEGAAQSWRVGIIDNGVGFDQRAGVVDEKRPHYGLQNMHERAASIGGVLTIQSVPDGGTRVSIEVKNEEARH